MAKVVLGFGSSHGPTIRTQPDNWFRLAERDKKDPRYSYDDLLKNASPDLAREITPEKQQERHVLAHAAIDKLAGVVKDAAPDVVVVISNQHSVLIDDQLPVMSVYRGESLADRTEERPENLDMRIQKMNGPAHDAQLFRTRHEPRVYPANPPLADHLIDSLVDEGFDVATWNALRPEHGVDEAFTTFYDFYDAELSIPMVPLMLNRYLPSQVKPGRAYTLGAALRRAIEAWGSDKRVALMASGGLSHQVLDEELDHIVIDALLENDEKALASIDRVRLNRGPGTPETLNWITVAGAMNAGMTLIDYVPCYRSLAGTGHGLTFGYWKGQE